MKYLLGYLACGLLLTAFVLWKAWRIDGQPLVCEGEWFLSAMGGLLMTVTWPFWVLHILEAQL